MSARVPKHRNVANGGGCVLVVDDDAAGRYAKARVLRQAGYTVVEAVTGSEGLRRTIDERPDLVLLDVRLPDISGLEVCRRIKADPATSPIPVLQMSASFRDDKSKVAGLEGGADGYITEPVEPSLLVATIAAFLRTRRAEDAVRRHALEWQSTFDAIRDGVALVDTNGVIVRSNRALASLLDRAPGESRFRSIDEALPPMAGDPITWSGLKAGERQRAERPLGDRVFALSVDPVFDHGELRGSVCIVSDITERKVINERLWHTQKLESIGLLAGGVAHDFNNLLTGILGNASLGIESSSDRASTERAFRDILRAGERAADLTRQLLAYAGKGKFTVAALDLSRIVTGMSSLVRASFPRKVELALDLASDLPAVKADKTQIEQVVMNLLINAAESIGDNTGTVTVTTSAIHIAEDQRRRYLSEGEVRGDYVELAVRDNGAGMDEDTIRQIFDPFFTTKFLGRGLGLSAVLGIVRGHKGAIRVTSAPGQGATFELLFPSAGMAARVEPERAAAATGVREWGGASILVVDDELIVRNFFKLALERYGYEVTLAADGAEALRIFAKEPDRFSIVLLDLVMPVMSGKEALPQLLEIRPDAKIIATSGQVEEEARRNLGDTRVAGFIQKPCAIQSLLEKIRVFAGKDTVATR